MPRTSDVKLMVALARSAEGRHDHRRWNLASVELLTPHLPGRRAALKRLVADGQLVTYLDHGRRYWSFPPPPTPPAPPKPATQEELL